MEAKEDIKESSNRLGCVGDLAVCCLWNIESRLCSSMIFWVSNLWPQVQVKSEAGESAEEGMVPGAGPET